ncbi:MAG: Nif3-like dinuclear metal center hexameric protein [Puniceicoccales bacterium]|jgi:dinuclear metal center YbgI/SA1388 family protein|nr:Nif3-like dinuclear metal center hexameric protein [Puniceicoccales bacterium]
MVPLSEIVNFCDNFLNVNGIEDYERAYNGLQFENNGMVTKIGAAVDANLLTIERSTGKGIDLLFTHHGMLWGQIAPVTKVVYKKYSMLLTNNLAIYGVHLPLDMHGEIGNNVSIMHALGLCQIDKVLIDKTHNFEIPLASAEYDRGALRSKLNALFPQTKCMEFGTKNPKKIAICSGGGGHCVIDMIKSGTDTIITGEGQRHLFDIAYESEINLYLCGHYATETFGVKNLAKLVSKNFDLEWIFIEEECEL